MNKLTTWIAMWKDMTPRECFIGVPPKKLTRLSWWVSGRELLSHHQLLRLYYVEFARAVLLFILHVPIKWLWNHRMSIIWTTGHMQLTNFYSWVWVGPQLVGCVSDKCLNRRSLLPTYPKNCGPTHTQEQKSSISIFYSCGSHFVVRWYSGGSISHSAWWYSFTMEFAVITFRACVFMVQGQRMDIC